MKTNQQGEKKMKIPKIRLRLSGSKSLTKHTLQEMEVCYDAVASRAGIEIYNVEQDCKSIKPKGSKYYVVEVKGYCYDSNVIMDHTRANEIWYNSQELYFYQDFKFDLKIALLDNNITMMTAIRDFGFVLEKNDPNYLELFEDYDYSKHLLSLPKDQRFAWYSFQYQYQNELKQVA